jgi:hypothetical protein
MKWREVKKRWLMTLICAPSGDFAGESSIHPFMIKRSNFMAIDVLRSARRFVGTV